MGGGIIAAAASLTTVVAWVTDELGGSPAPPPPKVADAQIEEARVVSLREPLVNYMNDTNLPLEGLSPADLQEQGIRAAVRVRFQGRVGQELPLLWKMRRANGTRLRGEIYNQPPRVVFTVKFLNEARTIPVWAPYPPRPGRYSIDFLVLDPKKNPLAEKSTPLFTIRRVPVLD